MAEHPPTAPLAHAGEESSSAVEQQYNENDTGHREVKELLNSCRLFQYLELFIAEGFDSLVSVNRHPQEEGGKRTKASIV